MYEARTLSDCTVSSTNAIYGLPGMWPTTDLFLTNSQREFLTEFTGRPVLHGHDDTSHHVRFMLCELRRCPNYVLHQALGTSSFATASETFFYLMKLVLTELKCNQQTSVDDVIHKAANAGLLQASCKTPSAPECVASRSLIIAAFGWSTMLYTTNLESSPNSDELFLDAQQAVRCSFACKLDEAAQRPLLEILGVICWVKCLGSHLDFDVVHRRLNLFCLPSFCDTSRTKGTVLALALEDCYEDWNKPAGFTTSQFVQEVLLSYKIFFASSRGARNIWRQKERMKAFQAAGFKDPLLDDLCGYNDSSNGRASYSSMSDFPIFAQRLQRIQEDILRQQPTRLSALWNDNRDMLRWYTFWAVIGFGFVTVLFAIHQSITSTLQTVYTIKAYNDSGSGKNSTSG
ncbi:hypothetical protein BDR22DRAFT_887989 [Usnea florida]